MAFIRAQVGLPLVGDSDRMFTVRYFDENGNMTVRSGGSRAWRCNNPGNLHRSPYSMSQKRGAIGFAGDVDDTYAVYPTYKIGHEALTVMLKGSKFSPLTLRAAMQRYDEKNKKYIDQIVKLTGLDPERIIKSLTDHEFEIFWKAIEYIEGWEVGEEEFFEKWYISGVHKKHGIIIAYLVEINKKTELFAKEKAINLAKEGHLHAIIVHLKNGTVFLRPEFGAKAFELVS